MYRWCTLCLGWDDMTFDNVCVGWGAREITGMQGVEV